MKQLIRLSLCQLLIASVSAFAQDTIVLKNGDTLTGEILVQNMEQVYFKSSAFGTIGINTLDIAEIHIETKRLGNITVPTEAFTPANKPSVAEQKTVHVEQTEPQTQKKVGTQKKKTMPWSGQAGLAIAVRESNTIRRSGSSILEKEESFESYRVYGNINWKGKRDDLRWNWTYRYGRSDIRKNDDYLNLTQNYKHTFKNRKYYATAKTLYQRDFRRKIDNEYLQTAELGIKWFQNPDFQLTTSAGGGYHIYDRTVYINATKLEEEYTVSEPKFIFDQSLRWQLIDSLTFIQKYTHLGDLSNYHFVLSVGMENKLVRDLFLRIEYRLDRDTEFNYDDKSFNDKAVLTSLLYKF